MFYIYFRLFGGLIQDIKRKAPFYVSDFKDALHVQTLASFLFLYFACLTPIITFGGLLADATKKDLVRLKFYGLLKYKSEIYSKHCVLILL